VISDQETPSLDGAAPRPLLIAGLSLGSRDLKAPASRRERVLVVGLYEQLNMRTLDAEVYDPEVLAPRGGMPWLRGIA